jgi:hypothetical protein
VQLLHRHLGCRGAQSIDELAFDQLLELIGREGALAERLRCRGNGFGRGGDAHVELGDDIDAHAVLGDQRLVAAARHLQAQRVHVDRDHVVDDRQHEGAAVEHDLLSAHAGADEGALLRAAQVQPVQQPDHDRDDDRDDDEAERKVPNWVAGHGSLLLNYGDLHEAPRGVGRASRSAAAPSSWPVKPWHARGSAQDPARLGVAIGPRGTSTMTSDHRPRRGRPALIGPTQSASVSAVFGADRAAVVRPMWQTTMSAPASACRALPS